MQITCMPCTARPQKNVGKKPGSRKGKINLVAAVISILPISLGGGLGTRELVFAEAAQYFQLDPQTGVIISLLFYLLTVAGSLPGLYFIFRDPLK